MKRFLLRIGDFLFVLRPLILIPAWSFYLLGARAGMRQANAEYYTPHFLHGFLCLTAILVTAYLINQIYDEETDRINNKGHYLPRGIFRARTLIGLALVTLAFASVQFRSATPIQRPLLLSTLVLSLAYSLPPFRLCARPFLDIFANAIGYGGIAFALGYVAFDRDLVAVAALSLPWILLVAATFLHTTILDVEGDAQSGKRTTTVRIGVEWSALWAVFLAAAATGWSLAVSYRGFGDYVTPAVLAAALVAFFAAHRRIRGNTGTDRRQASSGAVQLSTAVVTIPAAVFEPSYLLLIVPLIMISRYYHQARFGITYPGPGENG